MTEKAQQRNVLLAVLGMGVVIVLIAVFSCSASTTFSLFIFAITR